MRVSHYGNWVLHCWDEVTEFGAPMSNSSRTLAQTQILLASACCRIVVGNFVDTASREMCLSANIILFKSVDLCLRPVVGSRANLLWTSFQIGIRRTLFWFSFLALVGKLEGWLTSWESSSANVSDSSLIDSMLAWDMRWVEKSFFFDIL